MTREIENLIDELNGWSMDAEAFSRIEDIVPAHGKILELGSGEGTGVLKNMGYLVYSIEHDVKYFGRALSAGYDVVYAPLKDGWYDTSIVKRYAPRDYDLLIVDGPVGSSARIHLMKHLHLFRSDVPWLIDDTHRPHEAKMAEVIARELNFHLEAVETTNEIGKQFCILTPLTEGSSK